MKNIKKMCMLVSALLVGLNVSHFPVSAASSESQEFTDESIGTTFSLQSSGNNQVSMYTNGGFSGTEWEWKCDIYKSSDNTTIGEFVFGYDTDYINEDYTWARGSYSCKAGVMRHNYDSDYSWSFAHSSWNWGKKEVTHHSDSVSYSILFTDTNLDVYNGIFSGSLYKN